MLCRVKVTGSGVVAYEGEDGQEKSVPHGAYTEAIRWALLQGSAAYLALGLAADETPPLKDRKCRLPSRGRRGTL